MTRYLQFGIQAARRVIVGVVGGTIVAIGVAMLVLPGPAFVVIPVGLGILGLEFAWARRWLRKLRETAADTAARFTRNGQGAAGSADDEATTDLADDGTAPGDDGTAPAPADRGRPAC